MTITAMWLIVCGLCLILEIFTVGFLLFFPGVGAFLAFITALLGANITIQIIVFALSTTLMILFIRPLVAKFFKTKDVQMNSNALIGKSGIVLKDIVGEDTVGQVKVQGEIWSAICDKDVEIKKDTKITVKAISGVKLIVEEVN